MHKTNPSLRAQRSNSVLSQRLLDCFVILFLAMILAKPPSPAFAGEPYTYSPDYCEFTASFPGKYYKTRRCEDGDKDRCYDLISYTQVYQLSATVKFEIICNPSGEDLYAQYSGDVMQTTLKAMTEGSTVKTFDTSFREEAGYKQAGLVGEGKMGITPTIYIAQLWIGRHSIMSVKAELIGEIHDEADKLFSDILRSVDFVGEKKEEPTVKEETGEKDRETLNK